MVIKLAIKSGLAYSAMYYACGLGVWGTSIQTEKLYNQIKDQVRPHANSLTKQLPFEVPDLPETGEIGYLATHYYNKGVIATFRFITMLPCYAGRLAKKTMDTINKALEESSAKK